MDNGFSDSLLSGGTDEPADVPLQKGTPDKTNIPPASPLPAPTVRAGGSADGTKTRQKLPVSLVVCILAVSIVVSALSGAASSFTVFKLLQPDDEEQGTQTGETTTKSSKNLGFEETQATTENCEETQHEVPSGEMPVFIPSEPATENEKTTADSASAMSKGDIYAEAVNSIYAIKSEYTRVYTSFFGHSSAPVTSKGTGFAVNAGGYIVTNYHVIENGKKLTVTDYNGKSCPAKLIGSEPNNDIAVIKISEKTPAAELGSSSELEVGDDIMVIGNALGELSYTFTDGIISHLSRSVQLENGKTINMFQTNAAINSGNSGGPVYNMAGKVIGIASAKYSSESVEGLGFCIPIDDVKDMIDDIILYGYVRNKPSIGVSVQTVTASMSERYRVPVGCYIVAIAEASAANKAGLKPGDVITKLNGRDALRYEDIEKTLLKLHAGDTVKLRYSRGGENTTVNLTLDEYRPASPRTSYANVHDF